MQINRRILRIKENNKKIEILFHYQNGMINSRRLKKVKISSKNNNINKKSSIKIKLNTINLIRIVIINIIIIKIIRISNYIIIEKILMINRVNKIIGINNKNRVINKNIIKRIKKNTIRTIKTNKIIIKKTKIKNKTNIKRKTKIKSKIKINQKSNKQFIIMRLRNFRIESRDIIIIIDNNFIMRRLKSE